MLKAIPFFIGKLLFSCLFLLGSLGLGRAQLATIQISEINANDQVELVNTGDEMINVSSLWLCDFPVYDQIGDLTIVCGDMNLAPGDFLVVSGWAVDPSDGELGLYLSNSFGLSTQIIDYVESTVGEWVKHIPNGSFLVTSRAVLGITGEYEYPLSPLNHPILSCLKSRLSLGHVLKPF